MTARIWSRIRGFSRSFPFRVKSENNIRKFSVAASFSSHRVPQETGDDLTNHDGDVEVTPPSSQFGSRFLIDEENVFDCNAWDDVSRDEDELNRAKEKIQQNLSSFVSSERRDELERNASASWDNFYASHEDSFFRDRNWIFRVFPDLGKSLESTDVDALEDAQKELETSSRSSGTLCIPPVPTTHPLDNLKVQNSVNILEVGCGVGNVVYPVLKHFHDKQNLFVYCCDFAPNAVEILKRNDAFDETRCFPFQWDLTDTERELPVGDGTIGG